MKPDEVIRMEQEDEDEEFVGLNVDSQLLELVPKLFKTEPEVEVFYDGFLERIQLDKKLRKHQKNRKRMNQAFLDELLKYHDLDTINDVLNDKSKNDEVELASGADEKEVDRILRKTFKNKMEFRMFITYVTQFMMENKDTPVEAAAKSMRRLGKSDNDTLAITSIIDKIF
ncbi:MAG: hypothetical protein BZ137_01865 [Methanosphaera sp. rholeuAM130]|nr:hypothetical protein [Methanosphaera sp.]RAP54489.1 MAG: hypothetical protein BZ137_01865 [Methanosphaera sp. rholeuAM130]